MLLGRPLLPYRWTRTATAILLASCSTSALFDAVIPKSANAQAACDTYSHICKTVQSLGLSDRHVADDMEILAADPRQAVRLLILELHPIPRKAYYPGKKTPGERHIVAVLRSLHYLTGTTFSARTSAKLSEDEKQFLDFNKEMHDENPSHEIHFFGVWMSRDADFVAPEDAQREIIRKWQQWEQSHGKSFEYHPAKKPADAWDDYYWYG